MGTDLTFIKNADGSYLIKDKDGGVLEFVPGGYLYKIKDKNNNTITLSYDGIILKKITDGSGRVTTLDVLSNGYLVGIIDPSGRRTSFSYNGIQLSKITYPDNKYTLFLYDSDNKLKDVINHDNYKISYSYYSQSPYRVSKVEEFGPNGAPGGSLNISYGYNTTTFIDAKDRKNIYQFNDYGNTVSMRDDDESASYYKYMTETLSNKLSLESKLQKFTKNYLKNHNAETPNSYWGVDYWGISLGAGSFTTEAYYLGKQSLKIKKDNTDSRHFYSQGITLTKGKNYVLSGYIKTVGITNENGKGAALFVNYQDNVGAWKTVESIMIQGTSDWGRYEIRFTLPGDSASNMVYARAGIIQETGTAYFDCLQLEEGSIANRYNLIENADLSYGDPTPISWIKNSQSDEYDKVLDIDGRRAYRINGAANKSKYLVQTINVSGTAGDALIMSAWAKGDSVSLSGDLNLERRFSLELGLQKPDQSYEWHRISFNEDSSDWQYLSDIIVPSNNYISISMYAEYYKNVNTVYFTNFQLYPIATIANLPIFYQSGG